MQSKKEFRIKAKAIRENLDINKISLELVNLLKHKEYYVKARNVMFFYPLADEVDVRSILDNDKKFYLPRINDDKLEVCPYKNGDKLQLSTFKVFEASTKAIDASILDLVIVPALMVDKNNYRLGYGSGFYDKFLAANLNLTTVVLIPKELTIDELPIETHDIKIDFVISL